MKCVKLTGETTVRLEYIADLIPKGALGYTTVKDIRLRIQEGLPYKDKIAVVLHELIEAINIAYLQYRICHEDLSDLADRLTEALIGLGFISDHEKAEVEKVR